MSAEHANSDTPHTTLAATPTVPASPWLTVSECAKRARCGTRLIYAAIGDGRLRAAKLSGRGCFRVLESWLDNFLIASATPVAVVRGRRA